jgi:hypothetical protein
MFDQKEAEKRASPMGVRTVGRIVLVEHDNMHFSASKLDNSHQVSEETEHDLHHEACSRQGTSTAILSSFPEQQRPKRLGKKKVIVSV